MPRSLHKIFSYGAAGALGGSTAWWFVLFVSGAARGGLVTEIILGAITGFFIGGFIWSHETITGRQFRAAFRTGGYGAAAGIVGGAAGAALGNTVFTLLGTFVAELGGFRAPLGIAISVALGWAVLGSAVGASGGMIIRSRERILYGLAGGAIGGLFGGFIFHFISATNIWSAFSGLFLLGGCIGALISLVEEALVTAKVKVIKGRHLGREFPIFKEINLIGRDDRSDVCLSGAEGVGMQHAFIKRTKGSFVLEQGQGGTGLYVNHEKKEHCSLRDGDIIRVGSILLMFNTIRKAALSAAIVLILLSGLLSPVPAWAGEARRAQITQFDLTDYPIVKTYVSVLDGSGKVVQGLGEQDISLKENGRIVKVQHLKLAGAAGRREPLSISLVLDKSGSMAGNKIVQAKRSVTRFISLMETGDRASFCAFSDEVSEAESLTEKKEKLREALSAVQPGGHTALYDAIVQGVDSVHGVSGRKAVIVLSDGIANRGVKNIDQAIEFAVKNYVSVYVIGLGEDVRTARLERIAQETGGTYFFTPSEQGLIEIYETISRRIKNEYVVTYETEKRGEYLRKVAVSVGNGTAGERAYFQPRSSLFGAGTGVPGWAFIIPMIGVAGLIAFSLRNIERTYRSGHLSIVKGNASRKEVDVISVVTLGRDERNAIGLFKDAGVSQYHAEVLKENGHYMIRDKGSEFGTYVNEKKLSGNCKLADGDIIGIGGARIVFSQGSMHPCMGCGNALKSSAKFCPKCGAKANQ